MLALIALLLAADTPPPPPPAIAAEQNRCENHRLIPVQTGPLRARPLTEEPPGRQEKAVLHSVDGCVKPIVVRDNVGGR